MLTSLRIKNLAIVEDITVEFNKGLNVITGETGAGKSIIIGALSLVLGERADRSLIRSGEDQCSVEAAFDLADPGKIDEMLTDLGINGCDDGRIIIRRVITVSGGGKNIINDCSASLQVLSKVGDLLVDMHGPHDHQSLLNKDFQTNILDAFGHLWKQRSDYEGAYRSILDLEAERKGLDGDDQDVASQIDLLSFQVKEIEDAKLKDNEDEEVEKELAVASNSGRIIELVNAIDSALCGDESSAFIGMTSAQRQLGELSAITDEAAGWKKEAESIAIQIQELSRTITQKLGDTENDPNRLQWLDDRMTLINKIKRKYGGSIEESRAFLKKTKERLENLLGRGEKIKEIDSKLEKIRQQVTAKGGKLTAERKTAAKTLSKSITRELQGLGFQHGSFEATITPAQPSPSGCDEIEFGFAPNVGESMRPLRVIASSGEISRVMLAVKTILAKHDQIPVLVFDEIDSNIGGEMGNAIGERLERIADSHQLLCITHLPQVAVFGKTHYVVTKAVEGGRTRTNIMQIAKDERVEEIARMLGGRTLTSVILKHAKEMLEYR